MFTITDENEVEYDNFADNSSTINYDNHADIKRDEEQKNAVNAVNSPTYLDVTDDEGEAPDKRSLPKLATV